jgi:predicted RNA binding protein YcfA (HicA-like mRNA interferase family)
MEARLRRIRNRVLGGVSDRNLRFDELRALLLSLGFSERVRGSHHIFHHAGVTEIINLQPHDGGSAKPYQVRQVRGIVLKYKFAAENG